MLVGLGDISSIQVPGAFGVDIRAAVGMTIASILMFAGPATAGLFYVFYRYRGTGKQELEPPRMTLIQGGSQMTYVMVRHKVRDYQKWKEGFDADRESLERAGIQKLGLYRTGDDPKDIVVFLECNDLNQIKEFFSSDHFKEKIRMNGVIGGPEIVFLDRIEKQILGGEAEKAA